MFAVTQVNVTAEITASLFNAHVRTQRIANKATTQTGADHVGVRLSWHGFVGVLVEELVNLGLGKSVSYLQISNEENQP